MTERSSKSEEGRPEDDIIQGALSLGFSRDELLELERLYEPLRGADPIGSASRGTRKPKRSG